MVIFDFTVSFSDLALQILAGAIVAGLVGRILQGGGFGLIGDLLFGVIGAIGANFVVSTFSLFNVAHYGLPVNSSLPSLGHPPGSDRPPFTYRRSFPSPVTSRTDYRDRQGP